MKVIVGHINTDFDVLASMIAVAKLYPDAVLVFAGSQEKEVRDYLASHPNLAQFKKAKQINLSEVTELIIVDTRYSSRLGVFSELIGKPNIKVHLYDHHPANEGDIKADFELTKEVGATSTILVNLLKEKNIKLSPEEATLLALGIYEDTGSLTYATTTAEDLLAVAHLLTEGADLTVIPKYIKPELTKDQVAILNELIQSLEFHYLDGLPIAISTIKANKYIPDLAMLVQKLRDIENLLVIFVLVQLPDRVQVTARSKSLRINVAEILSSIGGGGHRTAASALVKNAKIEEVKEKILTNISAKIGYWIRAKDIMSSPVMTVPADMTAEQLRKMMLRYPHRGYPVMDGGRLVGLITREDLDKALHHGLSNVPISKFMTTQVITIDSLASLNQVRERMVKDNLDILPVTEGNRLVGIITHSDLIKGMQITLPQSAEMTGNKKVRSLGVVQKHKFENVSNIMRERLPGYIISLLEEIGRIADSLNYSAYIVGGFVRDLLLNVPNYDLDIVIEGDGINFARHLAKKLNGKTVEHKRFNTAIVILPDQTRIDVATARTEFYEYPAALPQVEASSIKHDLYRRDFTINAMAIKLNPAEFGLLYDYFGGKKDLKKKIIRVLHNLSFVEDPTRIFRAIRFEQRYNFHIEKHTKQCIANALDLEIFDQLGTQRAREELVLILSEPNPKKAIKRMHELNILSYIHPNLKLTPNLENLFDNVFEVKSWYEQNESCSEKNKQTKTEIEWWAVYFFALLDELNINDTEAVLKRFYIPKKVSKGIILIKQKIEKTIDELKKEEVRAPSQIYLLLKKFEPEETLLYLLAKSKNIGPEIEEKIRRFLCEWRYIKLESSGDDLTELGIPPGPIYKKILNQLLLFKLDGKIKSKADELEFVKREYGKK